MGIGTDLGRDDPRATPFTLREVRFMVMLAWVVGVLIGYLL